MLEAPATEAAVREALDVLGPDRDADVGAALTIVRDSVAKRVPRPADTGARQSRGLFGRSSPPRACSQMPELLAARAASRLSPGDVDRLAVHLDSCPHCDAVESRMAEAERAFRRQAEQVGVSAPPQTAAAAALASAPKAANEARPESPPESRPPVDSTWLPEPLRDEPADEDIRVLRVAAELPASAWIIPPAEGRQAHAPPPEPVGDAADWLVSDSAPGPAIQNPAMAVPGRDRRGGRRALRLALPVVVLAVAAGGALAATGAFDTTSEPDVAATPPPRTSDAPRSSAGSRTPLRTAAERRRAAERQRAAARRKAAARRAAARRRAPATAPVVQTPAATPAPVVRPPAPTATPSPPTATTPKPTPTTTTTRPAPPDSPRPSAPSSEPGRQPPSS
jgi:hypothetical protein